jgi:hypothetical protein
MHGGAAPRADTDTTIQILRYSCIVRFHRAGVPREALLCDCACPSQVRRVRDSIPKGAEPCLKQLEFALSTGYLVAPDPPKQQMIPIRTRSAKPDIVLHDLSMVQMNRVDVLC